MERIGPFEVLTHRGGKTRRQRIGSWQNVRTYTRRVRTKASRYSEELTIDIYDASGQLVKRDQFDNPRQ